MTRWIASVVLLTSLFIGIGQPVAADDPVSQRESVSMKLLVPAYFYPAGDGLKAWNRLIDSYDPRNNVGIVAIANINSGNVGTTIDASYADVIRRAAKKGITVIGYITSDYANAHGVAPLATAKTNVTNWFSLYPELHGIFIDEQSSDAAPIASYYGPLRTHINSVKANAFVIGNPGNNCVEDFIINRPTGPIMDVIIIHENNETKLPYEGVMPAAWMSAWPSNRFAMLVHTSPTFGRQIRLAKQRRTGYVYVTDAVGPPPDTIHPWGTLPTWWDDEIQMIGAMNDTGR